jgi:uncharacterized protein YkwD
MTKRRLVLLAFSSAALVACGSPDVLDQLELEGLPEPTAIDPTEVRFEAQAVDLNKLRSEMLVAVNKARAVARKCGTVSYAAAPPLVAYAALNSSAQKHATDMATKNFFSHTGSDGSSPFDRMTAAGYRFTNAGENIAAGNATVGATMTQWLNSPGHCANIMNKNYKELGVGYGENAGARYRYYWVQNFGRR